MFHTATPALVLGTAQLGMTYGIANRRVPHDDASAFTLIAQARALGVVDFDTARAYGESERRLGRALAGDPEARIVTKLAPLEQLGEASNFPDIERAVLESLGRSRTALRRERIDTLLLHRAQQLSAWGGAVWEILVREQELGRIDALGVSVQTPRELAEALDHPGVQHIQMPYNVLDWRWHETDLLARICERDDIVIHARSVFLQGLLAAESPDLWPRVPGLDADGLVHMLKAVAETLGRDSVADLCLAYARATPFLDGLVIGVETEAQLAANLALFAKSALDPDEANFVERFFPKMPESLLNPALWAKLTASERPETASRSHGAARAV